MVIRNTIQNTIQIRIIHNTHGFPVYYATLEGTRMWRLIGKEKRTEMGHSMHRPEGAHRLPGAATPCSHESAKGLGAPLPTRVRRSSWSTWGLLASDPGRFWWSEERHASSRHARTPWLNRIFWGHNVCASNMHQFQYSLSEAWSIEPVGEPH